jgi:hypothetical protein
LVKPDADVMHRAAKVIESCEHCHKGDAEIPFDRILGHVTGRSGAATVYILTETAHCPNRQREISEKTVVKPTDD